MKNFFLALLMGLAFSAQATPVRIVAAENFYGGVAKQIAGDRAEVISILSNPNQDPHEFTTSASTAKAVADADIVIYNGLGYDTWMDKLLSPGGKPGRKVICMANLIGAKAGDNPHLWYNPNNMGTLAFRIGASLATRENLFHGNSVEDSIDKLLFRINADRQKLTSGHPTNVTATEPVFGYMCDLLGFNMLNYDFQVNIMNDAEPSAAQTAAFEKSLRTHEARLLFYNSQVTDPTTERLKKIAQESGIPIIGVTETQPLGQKTYADWMNYELDAVEAGLKASSP